MKTNVKEQILKYLKDCITEDTKEELSIEIESKNINEINSAKIFFPDRDSSIDSGKDFIISNSDITGFFEVLRKNGIVGGGKDVVGLKLGNIDTLNNEVKEEFYRQSFLNFKKVKTSYSFLDYIKYDDNAVRNKAIRVINNHIYYTNSDKEYLIGSDLKKLFFAGDKKEDIEKIEFFGNSDFIDFYDKNKNEKIYVCLENIITERNKKLIFQPLYFVEVEIQEDTIEHFFTISLAETNISFNFYAEYYGKKLFKLSNKEEKEEGFELEKDIEGLSNFQSKIDLYKSKLSKDFEISSIKENACLISANDIAFIKGLLQEYNEIIENKDLKNTKNTGLGFLFNETDLKENQIEKLTNFTLLNIEQKNAVEQSLKNNLSVIVGPPGTGKSQVVVNIMLNAYINDKTVLFASKNNTAVDTVLEKVSKLDLSYYPFLRLGSKKSQDEWSPKIMSRLRQNNTTNTIKYDEVNKIIHNLVDLEDSLSSIEQVYLNYYQSYEDLEIHLNNYSDDFKKYIHQQEKINIDFDSLRSIFKQYLNTLEENKEIQAITREHKENINIYVGQNASLGNLYIKIKNNDIDKEIFLKKHTSVLNTYQEFEESEKTFHQETKILNENISQNNYKKILENISKELQDISLGEHFIDYNNFSLSQLKNILGEINSVKESNFLKKIFGFDKRALKKVRTQYFSIIDTFKNNDLQEYFFDIPDDINENNKLKIKIKEIIALKKFEELFQNNTKHTNELVKISELQENKRKQHQKVYQENIEKLKEVAGIGISGLNSKALKSLFVAGDKLFLLQETLLKSENTLQENNQALSTANKNVLDFLSDNIDQVVFDYFIKGINEDNLESNVTKIKKILKLEEIEKIRSEIRLHFTELTELSENASDMNKKILETQEILKLISIDFLSGLVGGNINNSKNEVIQSVSEVYEEGRKDFSKKFSKEVKNKYLISEFKKIINGIRIFITTNLATKSLPLEEGFFDYLIIDEASQNDIASIIPLLYRVKNVIIIGDPNQLENIVKFKDDQKIEEIFKITFQKEGIIPPEEVIEKIKSVYSYRNSVFKSFSSIYNSRTNQGAIQLQGHYRCNSDIINYSNFIIGEYNLFPKSSIENKYLRDSGMPAGIQWTGDIKTENVELSKRNEKEADAIIKYLKQIISALGNKVSIGVIAPFRNQVNYIKELIRTNGLEEYENILVDTVHKFQGDEKDIILFSTVYPNAKASSFLNNPNLLNVAVSRARYSFLIFGDKQAIKNYTSDTGKELLYSSLIHYTEALNKGKDIIEYKKYDTQFEKSFFSKLESAGIIFDYQYPVEGYNLDFRIKLKGINNYINIELDGGIHNKQKSYDYTRNTKVEKLGYKVIRYSNSYMMRNMGEIIEGLTKICEIKK